MKILIKLPEVAVEYSHDKDLPKAKILADIIEEKLEKALPELVKTLQNDILSQVEPQS